MRTKVALATVAVCAGARLGYDYAFDVGTSGVPPRRPLAEFPADAAGPGFRGQDFPLDPEVMRKAAVSEYVNRSYVRDGTRFWFYVGYYNGSTVDSIHQPEVCFPGSGFQQVAREVATFPAPGAPPLTFNLLVFEKFGDRRLTAYTFYYHGRFEPEEEAIYRGRAFSSRYYAVITVSAEVGPGERLGRARELLAELIAKTVPRLLEFFPEEPALNR